MPKLTELKGKENLPEKIITIPGDGCKCEAWGQWECACPVDWTDYEPRNTVIDQYNQLEIDGEVEELAKVLFGYSDIALYVSWDKLYKADKQVFINEAIEIISNLSKFLVIRKGC